MTPEDVPPLPDPDDPPDVQVAELAEFFAGVERLWAEAERVLPPEKLAPFAAERAVAKFAALDAVRAIVADPDGFPPELVEEARALLALLDLEVL